MCVHQLQCALQIKSVLCIYVELPPSVRVKQQAYIEIAEQSFAHLHTLSLQWHLKKKMGNVVRSMDRGTDAANNLITYLFLYLVPAIAECIATVRRIT